MFKQSRRKRVVCVAASLIAACTLLVTVMADSLSESAVGKPMTAPVLDTDSMEVVSNRHAHPVNSVPAQNRFSVEGWKPIASNNTMVLYNNEQQDSIRLQDKRSGYIWGAVDVETVDDLNRTWRDYGNSVVAIEYYDTKRVEKKTGLSDETATGTYQYTDKGFECHAAFGEQGISFDFRVTLDKEDLLFEMDGGSIQETKGFKLKSVQFMPFLGSTHGAETDGYFLLPDGPGALMRFKEALPYASGFDRKIYGKDYGIDPIYEANSLNSPIRSDDYLVTEPQILMPVYGIVHGVNHNGMFVEIEKGEEYASIVASPANQVTNYHYIGARFEYRQKYTQTTTRSGAGILVPQEEMNAISPKLRICLLTGEQANYSSMAGLYRGRLMDRGILKKERVDEQMPLRVDVLGGDIRRSSLRKVDQVFTTADQAAAMVQALQESGISNLSFTFRNYLKYTKGSLQRRNGLGSTRDFDTLQKQILVDGGRFYYYMDPVTGNEKQTNTRFDVANTRAKSLMKVMKNPNDGAKGISLTLLNDVFYYRLEKIQRQMKSLEKTKTFGLSPSFALDKISNTLYSDYTTGKAITRDRQRTAFEEIVAEISDRQDSLALYTPNQNMWQYASEFYDIPVVNSQLLFETDTVPFMQMVLKGSMDMYSTYLNTRIFTQEKLLRLVEYGIYPSFALTGCDSTLLSKTPQEEMITTNFEDWQENIQLAYQFVSEALSKVEGAAMIEHTVIQDGFVRVRYDNGVVIYLNYTPYKMQDDSVAVKAMSYQVIEK